MNKITLPQTTRCDQYNRSLVHVNCEHWSANKENCIGYCTLKSENTDIKKCSTCSLRKSFNIQTDSPQKNFGNQMKSIMEQTTFDDISKSILNAPQKKPKSASFAEKALSYSKVEGSQLFQGKVSEESYNKRKLICMTCPQRINPTPQSEEIGWCKSCGCSSRNPRAALTNKLWMPDWECPQKKFGKEEGHGFNIEDAANSLKGIATSVVSLFKSEGNT